MKKRRQLHYLQILWAEQNTSAFNRFEFVDFRKWHLKHRRILKAMCCTNKVSVRHVASRRVRWKSLLAKTQPKRWMVLRRCSRHTKSLDVTLHSFIRQTFLPRSILTASKQKTAESFGKDPIWIYGAGIRLSMIFVANIYIQRWQIKVSMVFPRKKTFFTVELFDSAIFYQQNLLAL